MIKIHSFQDFLLDLRKAGISMGGENAEGIFGLKDFFDSNICWHTEDVETDPWEWRMRVLNECSDIAYGKFFFKKSGFITKEWYPYFYAIRRGNKILQDEYDNGNVSQYAKKIYEIISEYKELPLHLIKQYGGFSKEDKSKFDSAITQLQMNFYITMCGRARKQSQKGDEYGWSSTVFCLTEDFFEENIPDIAKKITYEEAYSKIQERIYQLNPLVKEAKLKKFITG